uniref:PX domain-containing protein n=1 Tax=Peronospora matthiolae TaxID=2874970 RepID=A0AAV1T2G5_9STRA
MKKRGPSTRMSLLNQSDATGRELRLWLLSASTVHGVTFYRIAGRFTSSGQTWEVSHRYSEFLKLRDQLAKFLSASTDKCPGCRNYLHSIQRFDFPKKHLFASRAPPVVNYRVKALRSFLNLLASWAFSKTPKCPTCGGYAFEMVRTFVLEGDSVSTVNADMDAIRESVTVAAFAEPKSTSSRGFCMDTGSQSWMTASSSGEADTTQSMEGMLPGQEGRPGQEKTLGDPQQSRVLHPQHSQDQVSSGRRLPAQQRCYQDDDPYDAFNDYLPERLSNIKKATQSSMEQKIQKGKFSSRPLHEVIEERHQHEMNDTAARVNEQKLQKQRSEPRYLSASRPSTGSGVSVGTSAFESPRSCKRGVSRHSFDGESLVSDRNMATIEPTSIQGDDNDAKDGNSTSSVYSGDDEIELKGVTMASPPHVRKKSSADNLWQPWELARESVRGPGASILSSDGNATANVKR